MRETEMGDSIWGGYAVFVRPSQCLPSCHTITVVLDPATLLPPQICTVVQCTTTRYLTILLTVL